MNHVTSLFVLFSTIKASVQQALNDPIYHYQETRLGVRTVWWCPSGYGYLAFCPQPHDPDSYNWCCHEPYMGSWMPTCCPLAIPIGALVGVLIGATLLIAAITGFTCWCCPCCALYKRLYEEHHEEQKQTTRGKTLYFYNEDWVERQTSI